MIPEKLRPWMPLRRWREPAPRVSVIRLDGAIGLAGPLRRGVSAAGLEPLIARAFAPKRLAAVALIVNSPGGSPVQSAMIFSRIRAAAKEREVPVLAFVEDVAASGGYWVALAGDEVWADASSIVGSIGVAFRSFGLVEALAKLGIERRLHAKGEHKDALDPFSPEKPGDVAMIEDVQSDIFEAFKDLVRDRRGAKLRAPEGELFTGGFWSGKKALALGLIDGLGDARTVLRERFGDRVRLQEVAQRRSWWRRRLGMEAAAAGLAGGVIAAAEERALRSRYGL